MANTRVKAVWILFRSATIVGVVAAPSWRSSSRRLGWFAAIVPPKLVWRIEIPEFLMSLLESRSGNHNWRVGLSHLAFLAALLPAGAAVAADFERDRVTVLASSGASHAFDVEVADTAAERARGLMFRRTLDPEAGMLFDFRPGRPVSMWMKNTLIPLDMLFADATGRIVHIEREAVPETLVSRGPEQPVAAVLEIKGGRAGELGIEEGDRIVHSMFR
jgi:uncharacterized membrane protein (UPF0127 family)